MDGEEGRAWRRMSPRAQSGAGGGIELTLEIAGTAGDAGYPPDVVDTVTANARDLELDEDGLGFEKD